MCYLRLHSSGQSVKIWDSGIFISELAIVYCVAKDKSVLPKLKYLVFQFLLYINVVLGAWMCGFNLY